MSGQRTTTGTLPMGERISLAALLVAVLGLLIAWGAWQWPKTSATPATPTSSSMKEPPHSSFSPSTSGTPWDPELAATVNGRAIRESALNSIVTDFNRKPQEAPINALMVLPDTILYQVAATSPGLSLPTVSADEARSVIRQDPTSSGGAGFGIQDPSPAFVEFMQVGIAVEKAVQAKTLDIDKMTKLARDADIQVNPKYGTGFDAQQELARILHPELVTGVGT